MSSAENMLHLGSNNIRDDDCVARRWIKDLLYPTRTDFSKVAFGDYAGVGIIDFQLLTPVLIYDINRRSGTLG